MFKFWKQNKSDNPDPNYHAYTTVNDREIRATQIETFLEGRGKKRWLADCERYERAFEDWIGEARISAIDKLSAYNDRRMASARVKTVASVLVDHSGSMTGQRGMLACAATDIIAETWSRMGINVEILGYTTAHWRGGDTYVTWIKDGKPGNPGRLNDLLHIVYQDATTLHPGAPRTIEYMFRGELLKENIDGEAIQWAATRLKKYDADQRVLAVICDGAPVDDATLSQNPADYLERHIIETIRQVAAEPGFAIGGIGIDHELARYYPRSMTLASTTQFNSELLDFVIGLVER